MAKRFTTLLISALYSCTTGQPNWSNDSVPGLMHSTRLTFISKTPYPSIQFEIIKIEGNVEAFISLKRFHFTEKNEVTALIQIGENSFEDCVAVHEGGMRIRLHPETTNRIIQSLQDGTKVVILVDGFEETLEAEQFSSSFSKFLGESYF